MSGSAKGRCLYGFMYAFPPVPRNTLRISIIAHWELDLTSTRSWEGSSITWGDSHSWHGSWGWVIMCAPMTVMMPMLVNNAVLVVYLCECVKLCCRRH